MDLASLMLMTIRMIRAKIKNKHIAIEKNFPSKVMVPELGLGVGSENR